MMRNTSTDDSFDWNSNLVSWYTGQDMLEYEWSEKEDVWIYTRVVTNWRRRVWSLDRTEYIKVIHIDYRFNIIRPGFEPEPQKWKSTRRLLNRVWPLECLIDLDCTVIIFSIHIANLTRSCYFGTSSWDGGGAIPTIRSSVSSSTFTSISFISSRQDYCNSLFYQLLSSSVCA